MPSALWLLAAVLSGPTAWAAEPQKSTAPSYSATSIVNAATNVLGPLAPNMIATIYGNNLSYVTRAIGPDDVRNNILPTALIGTGVRVFVGGLAAVIYYASPNQINFLVPSNLRAGASTVQLIRDGLSGPEVDVSLVDSAPGFFQLDAVTVIAAFPDGSVVTKAKPAQGGQVIVLYAGGMGQTTPKSDYGVVPTLPASIARLSDLEVTFNGIPLDRALIFYAGITPGYAGLYQVNLTLPLDAPPDPEIRVRIGNQSSPGGIHVPILASPPQPVEAMPR
jgi:uncharacterized protein (TIGR03437 family)